MLRTRRRRRLRSAQHTNLGSELTLQHLSWGHKYATSNGAVQDQAHDGESTKPLPPSWTDVSNSTLFSCFPRIVLKLRIVIKGSTRIEIRFVHSCDAVRENKRRNTENLMIRGSPVKVSRGPVLGSVFLHKADSRRPDSLIVALMGAGCFSCNPIEIAFVSLSATPRQRHA